MAALTFNQFCATSMLGDLSKSHAQGSGACPECGSVWDEIDRAYEAAEILHEMYCQDEKCEYIDEEESLPDPWCGAEHNKWLEIWEEFEAAGITLPMALNAYDEVMDLAEAE